MNNASIMCVVHFYYAEFYFEQKQCFKIPSFLLSILLFEREQGHKMQLAVDQSDRNSEMIEILMKINLKLYSISSIDVFKLI